MFWSFFLCVFFFFVQEENLKGKTLCQRMFFFLPFYILIFWRFSFKKLRHRWKSKGMNPPEQVNNQIFFYGHLFISLIGSLRSWVTLQHIGSTFASRYAYLPIINKIIRFYKSALYVPTTYMFNLLPIPRSFSPI